jgi:hypothetical protein
MEEWIKEKKIEHPIFKVGHKLSKGQLWILPPINAKIIPKGGGETLVQKWGVVD